MLKYCMYRFFELLSLEKALSSKFYTFFTIKTNKFLFLFLYFIHYKKLNVIYFCYFVSFLSPDKETVEKYDSNCLFPSLD